MLASNRPEESQSIHDGHVVIQEDGIRDRGCGSSGRETYQRLLLAAGDTPIIILWGSQDEITLQEALAMGVRDYLEKGAFTSSDLSRVLRLARG